jgi:uncharacterized protein YqhQ
MNPRIADCKSSFLVVILIRSIFFPAATTINNTIVEVIDAIVSMGRMSSSPRLILNAVGTVDQNRIAKPA